MERAWGTVRMHALMVYVGWGDGVMRGRKEHDDEGIKLTPRDTLVDAIQIYRIHEYTYFLRTLLRPTSSSLCVRHDERNR